jgi:hypothetical protein
LITTHVSGASILSNAGSELSFQLPFDGSSGFPAMFEQLDINSSVLGVGSYGISVTTLEEVFLRVGHAAEKDEVGEAVDVANRYGQVQAHEGKKPTVSASAPREKKSSSNKGPVTIDVSEKSPILESFVKQSSVSFFFFTISLILGNTHLLWFSLIQCHVINDQFSTQVRALLIKRWLNTKRDLRALVWQIGYPVIVLIFGEARLSNRLM